MNLCAAGAICQTQDVVVSRMQRAKQNIELGQIARATRYLCLESVEAISVAPYGEIGR